MLSDVSGSKSVPIFRVLLMDWYYQVLFLPSHQQHPEVGTELVPDISENFHIFTLLSAREHFIGYSVTFLL